MISNNCFRHEMNPILVYLINLSIYHYRVYISQLVQLKNLLEIKNFAILYHLILTICLITLKKKIEKLKKYLWILSLKNFISFC